MTNITRKGLWIIVLSSLFVATFIFFCVATEGFHNWNGASWFEYWGKGKPKATVSEQTDQPVEQSAMPLLSSDVDHEIITDSGDSAVTFTTTSLLTPVLSLNYGTNSLNVRIASTIVGTVNVYGYPLLNTSDKSIWFTLMESDFTVTTVAEANIPFSAIRNKINTLLADGIKFYNPTMKTNAFTLYAENVNKAGYVNSGLSASLWFSDVPELHAEFTETTYRVNLLDSYYEAGSYLLGVYSNANGFGAPYYSFRDSSAVTYEDGYLVVDLLGLTDELATKTALDVYYIYIGYRPYKINTAYSSFTYDKFLCDFQKTLSFIVTRLSAPENLTYNAGTLSWNSVAGATQYGVFWAEGGTEKQVFVETTSYTFDVQALGEGEHTVRVRALGNLAQTAVDNGQTMSISAYNASNVVSQVVALTYNIDGDVVTKFVPYGSKLSDYIYNVNIRGREFGGWFYDSGFSRKVEKSDVISGDMTIYARLSDKKVTERQLSWWELHKWQVLIPCFVVAGLLVIAAVVMTVRKKKAAA